MTPNEVLEPDAVLNPQGEVIWQRPDKKPFITFDNQGIVINRLSTKRIGRTVAGIGTVGVAAALEVESLALGAVSTGLVLGVAAVKLASWAGSKIE